MTNEGLLQLMRIENYLTEQKTANDFVMGKGTEADWWWYHAGAEMVSDLIDDVELVYERA